jgi:hypothetical protein
MSSNLGDPVSEQELIVLREGPIPELKPIRDRLQKAGLNAELVPPDSCGPT